MHIEKFWYILATSEQLTTKAALSRQICNQHLVVYRDAEGSPVALPDRCLHRCGMLSKGKVSDGLLICPYHGWKYGKKGQVACIPSEGADKQVNLTHRAYLTVEQDGYIYVCLQQPFANCRPYTMPNYQKPGWQNVRLIHHFKNTVVNCVENFIDVPHTAFVHTGIFRSTENRPIKACVQRKAGSVEVEYLNESSNIGSLSWFLNPTKGKIVHVDKFFMPNITHVIYRFPSGWEYLITSQSIPINAQETIVYTDITYHFGLWTTLAKWLVKRQAKKVIEQDMQVLADQNTVVQRQGCRFINMPCDVIHTYISEIIHMLENGQDPCSLPDKKVEVTFYI